jgi:hypothetical protein
MLWSFDLLYGRCSRAGRSEPQRRLGRLHRLVDDGEQLGREAVQVDLLPQPAAEGLHGPGTDPYRLGCWAKKVCNLPAVGCL